MGTRALDPSRWLLVDDDWMPQRTHARDLLVARRDDVLRTDPALDDAAAEVGDRLHRWLAEHAPHVLDPGEDRDPLAAARASVAEDLCLLTRAAADADRWVLAAGAVCFPSYWRLAEKVGRPLGDVHEPVPGYAPTLALRVDTFLGRLRPGQGVHRRNWSIHDSRELFVPEHRDSGERAGPATDRWLRTEHQTLVGLDCGAVVFTIRTQQVPLRDVVAHRPDVAAALAAAVRGWTDAQWAYKGRAIDTNLLEWLDASAG